MSDELTWADYYDENEDREARARGMGVEWESRLQVGKNELMRDIREVMEHLIRRSSA